MKTLLIVFFVVVLLLLVICFPFKTRIMGHLNILEKKGFYSFKVWRIKLLCGMVWLDENNKLKIENTNNAIKDRYKDELTKKMVGQLMKLIEVKKVKLFFSGGFRQNSFSSALLCASAKMITDMFYSYLSQQYFDVKLYEDILPTFERDSFELTFDFVAQLSLLKIIKAFLKAKLMLNREVKNAER